MQQFSPSHPVMPTPPKGWALFLLVATFTLVGTIGHAPWRGDDLTYFGPIHAMLASGDWLVPHIAGTQFTELPPLHFWLGALLAKLLSPLLPIHDGARLASALSTATLLYFTGLTARRLYGRDAFAPAILLLLGSLGLVVHAHENQPQLTLLAAAALTLAGLADWTGAPLRGGLQAGLGSGLAFLAGGLPGLLLTAPLFLAAPLVAPACRSPSHLGGLAAGLLMATLLSISWPLALTARDPAFLATWWSREWQDILPHGRHLASLPELLKLLGWFAWPLWPIAGWTLWRARRQKEDFCWIMPGLALALALWLAITTGPLRPANMLPLLPPLALLAAGGVGRLRRGAANAFDWFALTCFTFFALVVWMGWSAITFGWPPGLGRQLIKQAGGAQPSPALISAVAAGVLTLLWLVLPRFIARGPYRSTTHWALGMTMLWCLAILLWQPWFDHTRSYEDIGHALKAELSRQPKGCVASRGLSYGQQAAFDYHAGIKLQEWTGEGKTQCSLVVVYSDARVMQPKALEGWRKVWEYRRGGGRLLEVFQLYRRD